VCPPRHQGEPRRRGRALSQQHREQMPSGGSRPPAAAATRAPATSTARRPAARRSDPGPGHRDAPRSRSSQRPSAGPRRHGSRAAVGPAASSAPHRPTPVPPCVCTASEGTRPGSPPPASTTAAAVSSQLGSRPRTRIRAGLTRRLQVREDHLDVLREISRRLQLQIAAIRLRRVPEPAERMVGGAEQELRAGLFGSSRAAPSGSGRCADPLPARSPSGPARARPEAASQISGTLPAPHGCPAGTVVAAADRLRIPRRNGRRSWLAVPFCGGTSFALDSDPAARPRLGPQRQARGAIAATTSHGHFPRTQKPEPCGLRRCVGVATGAMGSSATSSSGAAAPAQATHRARTSSPPSPPRAIRRGLPSAWSLRGGQLDDVMQPQRLRQPASARALGLAPRRLAAVPRRRELHDARRCRPRPRPAARMPRPRLQ
jgi:hypothetical protein